MSDTEIVQAVTFGLGDEVFAVSVEQVSEILDFVPAFRVPNGPDWLLGLTDVRGRSVPTVDFRARMGLPTAEPTLSTRTLIVDMPHGDRTLTLGLVVDRVFAVMRCARDEVGPAPDIGVRWQSDYIQGVIRTPEGFVILIELAKIFPDEEAITLDAVA